MQSAVCRRPSPRAFVCHQLACQTCSWSGSSLRCAVRWWGKVPPCSVVVWCSGGDRGWRTGDCIPYASALCPCCMAHNVLRSLQLQPTFCLTTHRHSATCYNCRPTRWLRSKQPSALDPPCLAVLCKHRAQGTRLWKVRRSQARCAWPTGLVLAEQAEPGARMHILNHMQL